VSEVGQVHKAKSFRIRIKPWVRDALPVEFYKPNFVEEVGGEVGTHELTMF
jgi:hypothetical protein